MTQNAKPRLKIEDITHDGNLALLREEVIVIEATEHASDERVAEMSRRIEGRDAAGQTLPDAEMSGPPSDLLPSDISPLVTPASARSPVCAVDAA